MLIWPDPVHERCKYRIRYLARDIICVYDVFSHVSIAQHPIAKIMKH